jgi:rare lipoprotein A
LPLRTTSQAQFYACTETFIFFHTGFCPRKTIVAADQDSGTNALITAFMSAATPRFQAADRAKGACSPRCRKMTLAAVVGVGLVAGEISAGICSDIDAGIENAVTTAMAPDKGPTDRKALRSLLNTESLSPTVTGTASRYNPFREGGRTKTSSGERYDPSAWTAAIRIDLRKKFGGVRYGKNYRPTYALVACDDKHVIVKINDVGRLKRGRVIDLNKRSMRYCNSSTRVGLIHDVKITLLHGNNWEPGPVHGEPPVKVAAKVVPPTDPPYEPVVAAAPATIPARQVPVDKPTPAPSVREMQTVVAEQVPIDGQTPEPIASEKPTIVAAKAEPEREPTPRPLDDGQPVFVAAGQMSSNDWLTEPTASYQLTNFTAAPYGNRRPPVKTEVAVAYSMLIAAIIVILRRPSAPSTKVPSAENNLVGARPKRRRKSRRKKPRAGQQTNPRQSRRKKVQKATRQSRG